MPVPTPNSPAGPRDIDGPRNPGGSSADHLVREMIEIRHVPGSTRSAYERIYAGAGIRQPDYVWDHLLSELSIAPGMRLLDVAGGEGGLARKAKSRGLEAHAVDLAATAVRVARASGVCAAVGNGERLPYPDGSFDRVVNFGSLEHYEDPLLGAREMGRVLAPGGQILIQVPNAFGLRWSVMHAWRHGDVCDDGQPIQRYATRLGWQRLLETAGLRVARVLPFEDMRLSPRGFSGWIGAVRHPSRLLIPVTRVLPVDMASMFVFVCTAGPADSSA